MTSIPASTSGLTSSNVSGALRSGDRWGAALLLVVMSGTHLVLVPDHLEEAPYAGILFLALGLAGLALAGSMLRRDTTLAWSAASLVALGALLAFGVSRTLGLPELGDDVGNWTEPLSFPALAAEAMLVALGLSELVRSRRTGWRRR